MSFLLFVNLVRGWIYFDNLKFYSFGMFWLVDSIIFFFMGIIDIKLEKDFFIRSWWFEIFDIVIIILLVLGFVKLIVYMVFFLGENIMFMIFLLVEGKFILFIWLVFIVVMYLKVGLLINVVLRLILK